MRRKLQEIDTSLAVKWLSEGLTGILSLIDEDGYPYQVPLNYVVVDNSIYCHSAMNGKKIDCVKLNDKVSFCIIEKDSINQKEFSTNYGSVVVQGKVALVNDKAFKEKALYELCNKYSKPFMHMAKKEIDESIDVCALIKIDIEKITGKVSKNRINEIKSAD